jgi:hypothetical protein
MKQAMVLVMVVMAASMAATVSADVLITQVLYNPTGSESGREAVELYNNGADAVDVSGWALATETSATDVVLPSGAVIAAGGTYLVADAGWSSSKDAGWPDAQHEEAMTLGNTDAGVALRNGSMVIDAVGWGDVQGIDAGLYEGTPHGGSSEGEVLMRREDGGYVDTEDNADDFFATAPLFHGGGAVNKSGAVLSFTVMVDAAYPAVVNVTITDEDVSTAGSQVYPVPKQNKSITVEAVVSDGNGDVNSVTLLVAGTVISLSLVEEIDSTTALYRGLFAFTSATPAGIYDVSVVAIDSAGYRTETNASFEYLSLVAIELDTSSIAVPAAPGSSVDVLGDIELGGSNVTITNIGNAAVDFDVFGTNLTSGTQSIDVSGVGYAFGTDMGNMQALSRNAVRSDVNLAASGMVPVSFRFSVPSATLPGNYTGSITLIAVKS